MGIEPTTCRLQGGCSSQLSYTGEAGTKRGAKRRARSSPAGWPMVGERRSPPRSRFPAWPGSCGRFGGGAGATKPPGRAVQGALAAWASGGSLLRWAWRCRASELTMSAWVSRWRTWRSWPIEWTRRRRSRPDITRAVKRPRPRVRKPLLRTCGSGWRGDLRSGGALGCCRQPSTPGASSRGRAPSPSSIAIRSRACGRRGTSR